MDESHSTLHNSRKEKLQEMLDADPKNPFLLFALAKEFENDNNDIKAEKSYLKLIEIDYKYTGVYYHFGKLLERQNRETEAREIYSRGIESCELLKDFHSKSELLAAIKELDIKELG